MKLFLSIYLLCGLCISSTVANAQNKIATGQSNKWENNAFTYGELKMGYGSTQFSTGLKEKFENGNFSNSGGILSSVAAYRKFSSINNLHFGLKFKALGATAANGDNGQEMFFNFWGTAVTVKYFPFNPTAVKGLFLQGDYNFITQFTQKYRTSSLLQFDHQFAIGSSYTLGLGYQHPLKNGYGLVTSLEIDWATRNGEVTGIGDKRFQNSNIAFQIGIIF